MQANAFERLCTAPCDVELENGTHKLALSLEDGEPVAQNDTVSIDGPAALSGEYSDRSGLRTAGWILVGGGAVLMVSSVFVAKNDCDVTDDTCDLYDTGLMIGMMVSGGVVLIAGSIMAFQSDKARISFAPGVAQLPLRGPLVAVDRLGPSVTGATAHLEF